MIHRSIGSRWPIQLDAPGWFLLILGEALMLSTWVGASHLFIGSLSLGVVTYFGGAFLCLAGPAFYGRGWYSAALGIGTAFVGLFGSIVVGVAAIVVSKTIALFVGAIVYLFP